MKKSIFLVILIIFLLPFFNQTYDLKIEFDIKNKNPVEIDNNIAKSTEEELLKISEVKELTLFSSLYGLNIYIKFKPYMLKNLAISKIERKINLLGFKNYKINDNYNLKYNYFIILTDADYYKLKKRADEILYKLLKTRFFNDVKMLGVQQKVDYIYFNANDLLNYDIAIKDIKKIIQENNIKNDFIYKNKNYIIDTKSSFKNIDDIKNITLKYKNSNFTTKFGDVFKIEKRIKEPSNSKIIYNNKEAIVLAISSKNCFSYLFLKLFLKKHDVEIIKPKNKKRIEFSLDNNLNAEQTVSWLKNNYKKGLFFIGQNAPKTANFETFDEIKGNRIVGFIDKNAKIFKTDDRDSKKISSINFKIDEYKLKQFDLSKKEVFNSLLTQNEGLICDYYWDDKDKVQIILKNKDNFIYSKNLKSLISLDEIISTSFETKQPVVVRKNSKTPFK